MIPESSVELINSAQVSTCAADTFKSGCNQTSFQETGLPIIINKIVFYA